MANGIYNYGQRRTSIDNPFTGESGWFNNVTEAPMGIGYLQQSRQLMDPTLMMNQLGNVPQGIPFHPSQGNRGRWSQANVPNEPGTLRNIWDTAQDKISGFTTPIMGAMKRMVEPNTPEENFGRKYFNMDSAGRTYGNQAHDVFAGKNVVSAFGQGMGGAAQKRIDTIENTLRTKYNLGEDEIEDVYAGTYTGPVKSKLIQRLRNFSTDLSRYKRNLAAGTGGTDTTGGAVRTGNVVTNVTNPNVNVGGATQRPDMSIKGFDPGLARAMGSYNRTAGPMSGSYGPYGRAEGGRIGYQEGELVEDESMFEATPRGMVEENIEEVQGEPTREQLEAIALEIFRLPLEQLNEQQLEVVYQAAMEQEPSEEEVQFAAQEGPGEGIASLV